MIAVALTVNGREVSEAVEPRTSLADVLRDRLALTGTHLRCEQGVCGACTLLVDGEPVRSCITFAVLCDGAEVTTIEGLEDDPVIAALRPAFTAEHALQCGYCTPAMLITARDIVLRLPGADEARIRRELSGNLCRCTGYVGIVAAIRRVMAERGAGMAASVAKRTLGPVGAGRGVVGAGAASAGAAAAVSEPPLLQQQAIDLGLGAKAPNLEIRDSFLVARPRDEVWALLKQTERVVACMPGASLTAITGDRVDGRIAVKLGPIGAAFTGSARVSYDEAHRRGTIAGAGQDRLTGSRAAADVAFAVAGEDLGSTRVDLVVRANLSGALAQFARAGIAADLARRLTRTFAHNLEHALEGRAVAGGDAASASLNMGALLMSVWRARVRMWLGRLIGRTGAN